MIKKTSLILALLMMIAVVVSCTQPEETVEEIKEEIMPDEAGIAFFNQLRTLCGNSYTGRTSFPTEQSHALTGSSLRITFEVCSEDEMRIPFQINNDTSRTFIIRQEENGRLELRHDISTEGEPSMYGGFADTSSTATRQVFRADEITVGIAPEAVANVWTMEIDLGNNRFIYDLKRGDEQRFRGVFDVAFQLDELGR